MSTVHKAAVDCGGCGGGKGGDCCGTMGGGSGLGGGAGLGGDGLGGGGLGGEGGGGEHSGESVLKEYVIVTAGMRPVGVVIAVP